MQNGYEYKIIIESGNTWWTSSQSLANPASIVEGILLRGQTIEEFCHLGVLTLSFLRFNSNALNFLAQLVFIGCDVCLLLINQLTRFRCAGRVHIPQRW